MTENPYTDAGAFVINQIDSVSMWPGHTAQGLIVSPSLETFHAQDLPGLKDFWNENGVAYRNPTITNRPINFAIRDKTGSQMRYIHISTYDIVENFVNRQYGFVLLIDPPPNYLDDLADLTLTKNLFIMEKTVEVKPNAE